MCIVWGAAACCASMTACVSIDLNAIDWDGDGVPDVIDAFPVDPTANKDIDGDGIGDNGDAFPQDPNRGGLATIDSSGETDNEAVPNDNGTVSNDTDTGNANDNSSDESPPPDANPPSSDGGSGGRRKTRN